MSAPALVTGANGYLGTQVVAALLRRGDAVRAVVRAADGAGELRDAVRRGGADDARLQVAIASLTGDDGGWVEAMAGVADVYHVASPMIQAGDPDEIIRPALEGTLRVLRAARDAGARRVVLTSSFAAVGYSPKPVRDYDETDWTDPDTPGLPAYPRSKAIAERAAWDFIQREGGGTELVVVNPTWIAGPTLVPKVRSSLSFFKALVEGTMTTLPRQRFGVVDVRDVAEIQLTAMATPEAAGKRYLALADGPTTGWLGVAQVLRDRLGPLGARITADEEPGEEPPPLVIHNDRARRELGFAPRPVATTLVDTVHSMVELGLIDGR